jgi:hypothetical protein
MQGEVITDLEERCSRKRPSSGPKYGLLSQEREWRFEKIRPFLEPRCHFPQRRIELRENTAFVRATIPFSFSGREIELRENTAFVKATITLIFTGGEVEMREDAALSK